jgi:5-formyltetrahydrofolate cyclo-ligase
MRAVARPDSRFGYDLTSFIPDFAGSERLFGRLQELPCYAGDGPVFVTPDNCLPDLKAGLIISGRPLLQTVAVALGFHCIRPGTVRPADARFAGTLDGALLLAEKMGLDAVRELGQLDFVVTGACAVDPRTGVRFGKGHGFFDTEWALLSELGVVSPTTPVIICVHDYQLVDTELVPSPHDTAGDWIITPTQTIHVAERHSNPTGVQWDLVDAERLAEIEPLRQLKLAVSPQHDPEPGSGKGTAPSAGRPAAVTQGTAEVQRVVREKVWAAYRTVARPDSRFHWDFASFIADFEGSEQCVDRVRALPAWSRSALLFITPDNSTELIRRAAMADGKPFLMTTYGIRRGFLALDPGDVPVAERSYAATLDGMDHYARPIDLKDISEIGRIGLLITGGSAVNLSGHRMGKGHGYFDLEWALLSEIGAVDDASEIVDIVHDCQLVDVDVAAAAHDVPVDWIITPTRTVRTDAPGRAPGRVHWDLVWDTELAGVPPVMELAALQGKELRPGATP